MVADGPKAPISGPVNARAVGVHKVDQERLSIVLRPGVDAHGNAIVYGNHLGVGKVRTLELVDKER